MIRVSTKHRSANDQINNNAIPAIINNEQQFTRYIIAQPNQSASWHTNKLLILALGLPCALIATIFSLAGAWVILPFAGLEITGIGAALYIVCRRLQHKHVLIFNNQNLRIEKGSSKPEQSWQFVVDSLSIGVERQAHPWDALKIYLYGHDLNGQYQQISVGEFLNKHDSQQLLQALRKQGLKIRDDSTTLNIAM